MLNDAYSTRQRSAIDVSSSRMQKTTCSHSTPHRLNSLSHSQRFIFEWFLILWLLCPTQILCNDRELPKANKFKFQLSFFFVDQWSTIVDECSITGGAAFAASRLFWFVLASCFMFWLRQVVLMSGCALLVSSCSSTANSMINEATLNTRTLKNQWKLIVFQHLMQRYSMILCSTKQRSTIECSPCRTSTHVGNHLLAFAALGLQLRDERL